MLSVLVTGDRRCVCDVGKIERLSREDSKAQGEFEPVLRIFLLKKKLI